VRVLVRQLAAPRTRGSDADVAAAAISAGRVAAARRERNPPLGDRPPRPAAGRPRRGDRPRGARDRGGAPAPSAPPDPPLPARCPRPCGRLLAPARYTRPGGPP